MPEALERYFAAAKRFHALVAANEPVPVEATKTMGFWLMMCLYCYRLPSNWDAAGRPILPLPAELTDDLGDWVRMIVSGCIPQWMRQLQKPGAPMTHPKGAADIALAIIYKKLCESGLIKDNAHTQTIMRHFGVSAKTVRVWAQEHSYVELAHFFPDAKDDADRARKIEAELPKAGARYQKDGHGTAQRRHPEKGRQRVKVR